jgi:hypothetical protein
MPVRITLYGDTADEFEDVQDLLDQQFPGSPPSNAETVAMLMDLADVGQERPAHNVG